MSARFSQPLLVFLIFDQIMESFVGPWLDNVRQLLDEMPLDAYTVADPLTLAFPESGRCLRLKHLKLIAVSRPGRQTWRFQREMQSNGCEMGTVGS